MLLPFDKIKMCFIECHQITTLFFDKSILGWLYCNKGKILYVNNSDQTVVALKSVIFFFQQEHTYAKY